MRLAEEDREKIREADFSTAYYDLVDDPDDWPGMIAYCQYKEDIIDRCLSLVGDRRSFKQRLLAHKDLTTGQIQMLKTIAGLRVEAYAQEAVDAARPSIERDALSGRVDELNGNVGSLLDKLGKGRIRRFLAASAGSVATGIAASLATYLLILWVPDVSGWIAARDTGALVKQVQQDLSQLRTAVEGRLGPLSQAVTDVEPAAGAIDQQDGVHDVDSPSSGVPSQFQSGAEHVFLDDQIAAIWDKAAPQGTANERNGFRKDICGAWIRAGSYGDEKGGYGWVAGVMLPNFPERNARWQPFHWQNVPTSQQSWVCRVQADGKRNILVVPLSDADEHPSL